jgi:hypothetical protein
MQPNTFEDRSIFQQNYTRTSKRKKKANEDFLDVMLSHPGVDGVSDKLDDRTIEGVAIVSCSMFL